MEHPERKFVVDEQGNTEVKPPPSPERVFYGDASGNVEEKHTGNAKGEATAEFMRRMRTGIKKVIGDLRDDMKKTK